MDGSYQSESLAVSFFSIHLKLKLGFRQMMKGEFLVVEYLGWDNSYTEIVSSDRLRPKNTNPPVTNKTFHKFEIPVQEDLRE